MGWGWGCMVYPFFREAMRLSFRDGEKAEKGAVLGYRFDTRHEDSYRGISSTTTSHITAQGSWA